MNKYPIEFPFPPTAQQEDIFDVLLEGGTSIVVQATAGAGKSATLVNATKLLQATGFPLDHMLFVAFNKAIVTELQGKLPHGVKACTMHSLGMQTLKDELGDVRLDNFKYSDLVKEALAEEGILPRRHKDFREISDSLKDLINVIRINTFEYQDASADSLLRLLEDSQPEFPKAYAGLITGLARDVLNKGVKLAERRGTIDFTDMLWLPWKLDLTPKTRYPLVMVDEGQDQSPLQRWLCLRAMKQGGRMLAVGDKFQAIYGFSGASPDSLDILRKTLGAEQLPLSVTWRCPQSHVTLAQAVIGAANIQAAPSAKEGIVAAISEGQFESQIKEGDVVLARTNRPLISQAFAFIKAGRRAKIRGREIGQGLVKTAESIVKELSEYSTANFLAGVQVYGQEKIDALYRRSDLNEDQVAERVAEVNDRTEVLSLIAENTKADTFEALKVGIERLFDDSLGDFILLSTVHKAKGLEFDDVYLIDCEKMPAPFAKSAADKVGEECVLFVALTRGKRGLYFVGGLPRHAGVERAYHDLPQVKARESAA